MQTNNTDKPTNGYDDSWDCCEPYCWAGEANDGCVGKAGGEVSWEAEEGEVPEEGEVSQEGEGGEGREAKEEEGDDGLPAVLQGEPGGCQGGAGWCQAYGGGDGGCEAVEGDDGWGAWGVEWACQGGSRGRGWGWGEWGLSLKKGKG